MAILLRMSGRRTADRKWIDCMRDFVFLLLQQYFDQIQAAQFRSS